MVDSFQPVRTTGWQCDQFDSNSAKTKERTRLFDITLWPNLGFLWNSVGGSNLDEAVTVVGAISWGVKWAFGIPFGLQWLAKLGVKFILFDEPFPRIFPMCMRHVCTCTSMRANWGVNVQGAEISKLYYSRRNALLTFGILAFILCDNSAHIWVRVLWNNRDPFRAHLCCNTVLDCAGN